jgi:hypothetical protein
MGSQGEIFIYLNQFRSFNIIFAVTNGNTPPAPPIRTKVKKWFQRIKGHFQDIQYMYEYITPYRCAFAQFCSDFLSFDFGNSPTCDLPFCSIKICSALPMDGMAEFLCYEE